PPARVPVSTDELDISTLFDFDLPHVSPSIPGQIRAAPVDTQVEDEEESNPPWTPMHVDPRSSDYRQPSWPHPLGS
nr:hypothetical protein [Tanacetum cinerariifolium]